MHPRQRGIHPRPGSAAVQIPELHPRTQLPAKLHPDRREPEPHSAPDENHHHPRRRRLEGGLPGQPGADRYAVPERHQFRADLHDRMFQGRPPRRAHSPAGRTALGAGRIRRNPPLANQLRTLYALSPPGRGPGEGTDAPPNYPHQHPLSPSLQAIKRSLRHNTEQRIEGARIMPMVISPAKTLDYETAPATERHTLPRYLDHSRELIDVLREQSPQEIAKLMSLSDKLAALNVARYGSFSDTFTTENSKQAALAYKGDV